MTILDNGVNPPQFYHSQEEIEAVCASHVARITALHRALPVCGFIFNPQALINGTILTWLQSSQPLLLHSCMTLY